MSTKRKAERTANSSERAKQFKSTISSISQDLKCSITQELLVEPVIAVDGMTYERSEIEQWFLNHDTSPSTNVVLNTKRLIPNNAVKQVRPLRPVTHFITNSF